MCIPTYIIMLYLEYINNKYETLLVAVAAVPYFCTTLVYIYMVITNVERIIMIIIIPGLGHIYTTDALFGVCRGTYMNILLYCNTLSKRSLAVCMMALQYV